MQMVKKMLRGTAILFGLILGLFVVLIIVPEKETVPAIQPRDTTQYWEMSEGFRIAYTYLEGEGEEEKEPIIFLHGGPGGYIHSSLIEVAHNFAMVGHDVYLYDQRGSGLS